MAFSAPYFQTDMDLLDPQVSGAYVYNPSTYQLFGPNPPAPRSPQEQILRDQMRRLQQQITAANQRIDYSIRYATGGGPTPELWLDRERRGGELTAFDRENSLLQGYAEDFLKLYKELEKMNPAAAASTHGIPLLDAQGNIYAYRNPANPDGPISERQFTSADARLRSSDAQRSDQIRGEEIAQRDRATVSTAENQRLLRRSQDLATKASVYKAELEAALKISDQEIRDRGLNVSLFNKQMDARIATYKESVDLLKSSVGHMSNLQSAELVAWTQEQNINKDVFKAVLDAAIQNNNRLSREEDTEFAGAYQQRAERIKSATTLAKALHDDFKASLANTFYAPQEWWDQLQKGMMAMSAGRMIPRDVMQAITSTGGMRRFSAHEADPQFLQRTFAGLMGGDATVDNPYGSDVRVRRGPRRAEPEWQGIDYASRPDMDTVRGFQSIAIDLGLAGVSDPAGFIPGAEVNAPSPRTPSVPSPLPTGGFDTENIYGDEDETETTSPPNTAPDGTEPFWSDTGEEASFGGGFQMPGEPSQEDTDNAMALTMAYLMPPLQNSGMGEEEYMPLIVTTAGALYNGWNPADVAEELWAPATGLHWTMTEENDRLQEELASLENEDDDYGYEYGDFGGDYMNWDFG